MTEPYAGEDHESCPDGGACHHNCARPCWRVENCGPLSGVFADDKWPDGVTSGPSGGSLVAREMKPRIDPGEGNERTGH